VKRRRLLRVLSALLAALSAIFAFARVLAGRVERDDPRTAGAPGQFVEIDGNLIHYVGAGQGDAVILLHGVGGSTFTYRYTIPELARYFRVVAVDLLGCGYSARPPKGDYRLSTQARMICDLMDRLGIDRASVIGHSMGGPVAMRMALSYPERVSRLVLVSSATDEVLRRGARPARLFRPFMTVFGPALWTNRRFRRWERRTAVHDPAHITDEVLEGHIRFSRMKGNMRAQSLTIAGWLSDPPFDSAQLAQPALVLWGEHDRWLPLDGGRELAESIPGARLEVVPSAGHMVLEEQPATSNRVLLDFLREGSPAPAIDAGEQASIA
jgi:pimeloyl-ACP methyl ester carboxylesterase